MVLISGAGKTTTAGRCCHGVRSLAACDVRDGLIPNLFPAAIPTASSLNPRFAYGG
jgi:hypothetical protein